MSEVVTTGLTILALLIALVLWEAPGILVMLAAGLFAVLLSVAERISGAPPGSYLRALEDELSARRRRVREQGGNNGDHDG